MHSPLQNESYHHYHIKIHQPIAHWQMRYFFMP